MSQKKIVKRHNASMGTNAGCLAYYESAMRFYSATPWRFIESMVPFAVYPPDASAPLVASVLGAGGEEYGLGVYRGDDVFEHVRALTNGEMGVRLSSKVDALSCMFEPYGRMPKEVRAPILRAGAKPTRDALVPWAIAKRPFKTPANPTDTDLALLGTLMDAILAALEKKILPLAGSFEAALRIVRTEGRLEVSVEPFTVPAPRQRPAPATLMLDRTALARLPIMDAAWHVGCPVAPISVADMDDELRALVAVAEPNGIIVGAQILHGERALDAAAFEVVAMFSKLGGIPREIFFTEVEVRDALAMHLEPRGVVCALAEVPSPILMEALTALFGHLSGERPPSSRRRRSAR
jgi:hypothetical protein